MRLLFIAVSVVLCEMWNVALGYGVLTSGLAVADFAFGTSSVTYAAALLMTYVVFASVIIYLSTAATGLWKISFSNVVQWILFVVVPNALTLVVLWTLRAEVEERLHEGYVVRVIVGSLLVSLVSWVLQKCVDRLNMKSQLSYCLPRAIQLAEEIAAVPNLDTYHRNLMTNLRGIIAKTTKGILTCDDTSELRSREIARASTVEIRRRNLRAELNEGVALLRDVHQVLLERGALGD